MTLPRTLSRIFRLTIVLVLVGGAALLMTCERSPQFPGPLQKIALGTPAIELSALIWVAENQGYFKENGLDVSIKIYESGVAAVSDVLSGNLDVATAGEFVVVGKSSQSPNLRILATMAEYGSNKVVARRDQGISEVPHLKGKRIGVPFASQAEFCLSNLLIFNSLSRDDVHLVNLRPSALLKAIQEGEIDAVVIWEPLAEKITQALGPNAISWSAQNELDLYWVLVSKEEIIKQRSTVFQTLLRALVRAERFLGTNPSEAKAITARLLNLPLSYMEAHWKENRFELSLTQSLLLTMEAQARWLRARRLPREPRGFDSLGLVRVNELKSVSPTSVSVIHEERSQ